jgi:hypothetical protein
MLTAWGEIVKRLTKSSIKLRPRVKFSGQMDAEESTTKDISIGLLTQSESYNIHSNYPRPFME